VRITKQKIETYIIVRECPKHTIVKEFRMHSYKNHYYRLDANDIDNLILTYSSCNDENYS
jgi:predicted solute-binding protein